MAVYRRTARPRFTLLLLVLTSITAITLDYRGDGSGVIDVVKDGARDAFAPVESATDSVFSPVGDFFQGVFNYDDLEAENARLREQLEDARGKTARAEDADRERQELLEIENLEFVGNIPTVAARVVTTFSNFDLTLQIDRGRNAGVAKGMPVVTGAGLVGRVVDVSNTRSTVLLVTDPQSSVGIRLTKSQEVGVATGRGNGKPLSVGLVAPTADVSVGEVVVTSGLQQSVFPPSIPVGKVRTAPEPRDGAFEREVTITPAVEVRKLTFVKILQWSPR